MKTLIIAEAGVNHNGDMEMAYKLIDVAVEAGVDMVKFQTFRADRLLTTNAKKANYQCESTDKSESQYELIQRLELSLDMHKELIAYCKMKGIQFFSTGFDSESTDLLLELGIDRFKIPSGEITNLPYLRHVGGYGKQIILSTGMANLDEVKAALDVLEFSGTPRSNITVLHCNTEYPTPMSDVNLNAMLTLRDEFGVRVGYSDHTLGIEVPTAAVALGASVIEKHFTLDRSLPGPDHKASLEPGELKAMVVAIRNIEKALGSGIKSASASEIKNMSVARKSIIASRMILKGDIFDENNLVVKRPGNGISPMQWDDVLGRKAIRDFLQDELIQI